MSRFIFLTPLSSDVLYPRLQSLPRVQFLCAQVEKSLFNDQLYVRGYIHFTVVRSVDYVNKCIGDSSCILSSMHGDIVNYHVVINDSYRLNGSVPYIRGSPVLSNKVKVKV